MSKLIVEMEMPKSCPCDLIGVGYAMCCSATIGGIPKRIAEYDECVKNGTRPSWCPIIGELPEQHGEWIELTDRNERKYSHICSNCHRFHIDEGEIGYYHYCPNCGAKMDGKEQNDE